MNAHRIIVQKVPSQRVMGPHVIPEDANTPTKTITEENPYTSPQKITKQSTKEYSANKQTQ